MWWNSLVGQETQLSQTNRAMLRIIYNCKWPDTVDVDKVIILETVRARDMVTTEYSKNCIVYTLYWLGEGKVGMHKDIKTFLHS